MVILPGGAVRDTVARIIYAVGINHGVGIIDVLYKVPNARYNLLLMSSQHNPSAAGTMVLLPRLAKQVMRRSNPQQLGMDLRLLMALSYLGDHDGAPQQELVDALCIDAKNVVLVLNELEDCGHLIRRRDSEDRRRHRVYITKAGRQALERAARAQEEIEDDVLQGLDADERATLWDLLARALRAAEHTVENAPAPILAGDRQGSRLNGG
jgi:DNA-binding MarR family transcriptional regulator